MEDIQELKPTLFCAVPRVYERIYAGFAFISLVFLSTFMFLTLLNFLLWVCFLLKVLSIKLHLEER